MPRNRLDTCVVSSMQRRRTYVANYPILSSRMLHSIVCRMAVQCENSSPHRSHDSAGHLCWIWIRLQRDGNDRPSERHGLPALRRWSRPTLVRSAVGRQVDRRMPSFGRQKEYNSRAPAGQHSRPRETYPLLVEANHPPRLKRMRMHLQILRAAASWRPCRRRTEWLSEWRSGTVVRPSVTRH